MSARSRLAIGLLWFFAAVMVCNPSFSAPVPVRSSKGSARAYLVLRDGQARVIAQGDWWQVPHDDRLEVHLRFDFTDGSMSHETYVLAHGKAWTLLSYRSEQKGPSFPRDIDARVERGGRYTVRTRDRKDGDTDVDEGEIELPDDVYTFGILAMLLENLRPGEGIAGHAIAFTPKPRVLKLDVSPAVEDAVDVAGGKRKTLRYVAKAKLGGLAGAAASIMGKQPPDLRYWMAADPVSTFLRVDTPLYAEGPVWHVELTAPDWRAAAR